MDASSFRRVVTGLFLVLCATGVAISASSAQEPDPDGAETLPVGCGTGDGADQPNPAQLELASRALATHNSERVGLGLPPLVWNCALERDAAHWAAALQQRGALEHAAASVRNGSGENLWMGTAGRFPIERMVGRFIEEKRHYRHGRFPDVSLTGDWADAAHYTQVVWRDTREVGCAVAPGQARDVLVCRYRPGGNVRGRTPF